ncbi:PREDICTED: cell wall protein IFF6-like [Priapulus caudatus]|uniref:Cell wall protein IFF6-like n=1 Tax=Priapulus caudatus TaxID=37621 RepID=A0ABM1E5F5_PRICU|nr:PREDICTED: cell wall protein IFF6-like [Priapulus caudatus]
MAAVVVVAKPVAVAIWSGVKQEVKQEPKSETSPYPGKSGSASSSPGSGKGTGKGMGTGFGKGLGKGGGKGGGKGCGKGGGKGSGKGSGVAASFATGIKIEPDVQIKQEPNTEQREARAVPCAAAKEGGVAVKEEPGKATGGKGTAVSVKSETVQETPRLKPNKKGEQQQQQQ